MHPINYGQNHRSEGWLYYMQKIMQFGHFSPKIPNSEHRAITLTCALTYHNIGWHVPSIENSGAPFRVMSMYEGPSYCFTLDTKYCLFIHNIMEAIIMGSIIIELLMRIEIKMICIKDVQVANKFAFSEQVFVEWFENAFQPK